MYWRSGRDTGALAAGLGSNHFGGHMAKLTAVDKKALRTILLQMKEGTTEIMLHPGTDNQVLIPATAWDHDFEAELDAKSPIQHGGAGAPTGHYRGQFPVIYRI